MFSKILQTRNQLYDFSVDDRLRRVINPRIATLLLKAQKIILLKMQIKHMISFDILECNFRYFLRLEHSLLYEMISVYIVCKAQKVSF